MARQPSGISVRAAASAARAFETVYCSSPGFRKLTDDLLRLSPAGSLDSGLNGSRGRRALNAAALAYCQIPPPLLPEEPDAPMPGQCPIAYRVSGESRYRDTETGEVRPNRFWRPLQAAAGPFVGPLSAPFMVQSMEPGQSSPTTRLYISHAGGTTLLATSQPSFETPLHPFRPIVTAVDGSDPASCGVIPPRYGPILSPSAPPLPPPETYPLPGPGGGGSVDYTFSPRVGPLAVDVDLNIWAPVTVNVISLRGGVNLDLDFDIPVSDPSGDPVPRARPRSKDGNGNPSGGAPPPGDRPDSPGVSAPEGEKPPDDPSKPPYVLVGASIAVSNVKKSWKGSIIYQSGNPNLHVPSLGHVNFGYQALDGSIEWSADIPVKALSQHVPAPRSRRLPVVVRGTPQTGVEWSLRGTWLPMMKTPTQ